MTGSRHGMDNGQGIHVVQYDRYRFDAGDAKFAAWSLCLLEEPVVCIPASQDCLQLCIQCISSKR